MVQWDLMENNSLPDASAAPSVVFTEPPCPKFCSFNECKAGHRWPPTAALVPCPGCGAHDFAVQKTNCPFCNEPIVRTVLRSDFIPKGGGVAARCQGAAVLGETLDIEMVRQETPRIESSPVVGFLQKQALERAEWASKEAAVANV